MRKSTGFITFSMSNLDSRKIWTWRHLTYKFLPHYFGKCKTIIFFNYIQQRSFFYHFHATHHIKNRLRFHKFLAASISQRCSFMGQSACVRCSGISTREVWPILPHKFRLAHRPPRLVCSTFHTIKRRGCIIWYSQIIAKKILQIK